MVQMVLLVLEYVEAGVDYAGRVVIVIECENALIAFVAVGMWKDLMSC